MDIYELKFTNLQLRILRFLFIRSGASFNARAVSKVLKVTPTAISKALKYLVKQGLIKVSKDKESKRLSIELNRDNPRVFYLKRVDNLKMIYESGLANHLSELLQGSTLILFGSFSFGEDTIKSDIDIAVIGSKEKDIDLAGLEKLLERKISLHFFEEFSKINKNLKENILNGITVKGAVKI